MNRRWYVLTGGPCSGKTTLLEALSRRGYRTVPEAARTILAAGRAAGNTVAEIHADEHAFQRAVLAEKVRCEAMLPTDEIVFFDRGIQDSAVYFARAGYADDPELRTALAGTAYAKAFLLALLPYCTDADRTETQEEAEAIHAALRTAYQHAGIPVVDVPMLPTEARADFVLQNL